MTERDKIQIYPRPDTPVWEEENLTMVHYELLTRKMLLDMDKSDALVVLPVALMEVHGTFLPIGTDYIESVAWGNGLLPAALKERRKDKHYTCVLYPPIPLGTGGLRGMTGTVNFSRQLLQEALFDTIDALVEAGFKRFFLCTAHHGNTHGTVFEEVVHKIRKKYRKEDVRVASPVNFFVQRTYVSKDTAFWDGVAEKVGLIPPLTEDDYYAIRNDHHSSLMEVSFMKELNPEWVDPSYKDCKEHLEGLEHGIKSLLGKKWAHLGGPNGCGYNGDPSRVDDRDWFLLYNEVIRQLSVEMVDGLYAEDPREFDEKWLSSFQWQVKLLRTNLKWWFLGPIVAFLFIFPWVNFLLPTSASQEGFSLWAILSLAIYLISALVYFIVDTKRVIGSLGQESGTRGEA